MSVHSLDGRSAEPRVSEMARVIAELVPSLPVETVVDLGRLVQRRLTMVDSHATRFARLGLLIDMVSEESGEVPSTDAYDRLRAERLSAGEVWPAHSTLCVAFGGWVGAVRTAMLLVLDGSRSPVPARNHYRDAKPVFSLQDCVAAFIDCSRSLGVWPTEHEYEEWRRLSRELARLAGKPYPHYPSAQSWRRLFGPWVSLETAARRALLAGSSTTGMGRS